MQIRRATLEDAGTIAAIHVASSRAAYSGLLPDEVQRAFTVERREATWREILTTRDGDVWIAEDGGRDRGWICVGASRDPDAEATTAELRAMYIEPASWRRGIGRALWAHAEAFLRSQGYARVTLWVFQENARALAFYRQAGFAEDAGHAITRDRGGVQLVAVRLRRDLGDADADAVAEEMKKLQGTWKQIGYERDGVTNPPDEEGWEPRVTFAGDTFVVTLADGSVPIRGTYKLDPTKDPKTVDWMDDIGEDAGKTLLAIYALEKDRLTFCAAIPGGERPTEFKTRPGQVLRISQREKP